MPAPTTTNVGPKKGVSTAMLFGNEDKLQKKLEEAVFADAPKLKYKHIPDLIANPQIAHFLNTDCVSCHSESTRRKTLGIDGGLSEFRFVIPAGVSGVEESVLPTDKRNVRNFGWFPPSKGPAVATATVRTANESAESAEFINREYLNHRK